MAKKLTKMIAESNCSKRKCKHFLGVIQANGTEMTETVNCMAYPQGIPTELAYGCDKHLVVRPDQKNNFVFEKEIKKCMK